MPWEKWPDEQAHNCVLGSLNYLQSIPFQFNHDQIMQREIWDLGHPIGALPCRERMERPHNAKLMAEGIDPTDYWNLYWKWKETSVRTRNARTSSTH